LVVKECLGNKLFKAFKIDKEIGKSKLKW